MQHLPVSIIYTLKNINQTNKYCIHFTIDEDFIELDDREQTMCLGFVEPKSNKWMRNTMHIENIEGCSACKNEPCVDDILIVWCATRIEGDITVVGWYKNATVFRELQEWTMVYEDGSEEDRCYNVIAETRNCTLLPVGERNRHIWSVPSARYTKSFGFGQAMVWYPTEDTANAYLEKLIHNIENYDGDNRITKTPTTTATQ